MTTVAKRYGVSSNYLARICERLHVPRPPRGYWAKLRAGYKMHKTKLPDPVAGQELEWRQDEGAPRVQPGSLTPPPRKMTGREGQLPTTHELVAEAGPHFDVAKVSDGYLYPSKRRIVDVFASKDAITRALDLANSLFLAFEARRCRVSFAPHNASLRRPNVNLWSVKDKGHIFFKTWAPDRATVAHVGVVIVSIAIFEIVDNDEPPRDRTSTRHRSRDQSASWSWHRTRPSGLLAVHIAAASPFADWSREWRESTAGDLLEKSSTMVNLVKRSMSAIATQVREGEAENARKLEEWKAEMVRHEEREARERVARASREMEERRVRNIKDSRDDLQRAIQAWGEAKAIENFFADAENRAAALPYDEKDAVLRRLKLAREFVGEPDALAVLRAWRTPDER